MKYDYKKEQIKCLLRNTFIKYLLKKKTEQSSFRMAINNDKMTFLLMLWKTFLTTVTYSN
jgi:hypothetical protein